MKHWRQLAAIVMAGIMVFALAACNLASQETKATEPAPTEKVEMPTGDNVQNIESTLPVIDPETYREFITTWYADGSSASYRLNIKDNGTWDLTDASAEVVASGTLRVNEEDQVLEMYDPDGSPAITATLEKEDTIYVEIMLDTLSDSITTNVFLNKITNDISDVPPADLEVDESPAIDEGAVVAPPVEEEPSVEG